MDKERILVPFWSKKNDDDTKWWRNKYVRKTFLIIKWFIYFYSGFMIMWSFIQSFAAPYTNYHQNPGVGLEFGYYPHDSLTKSGDIRFDLGSWSLAGPRYHAFWSPATVYGPFLSWFVYPVAKIFLNLIYEFSKNSFLDNTGLSVIFAMIIVMFVMRFINFWPTLRSSLYMEKQMSHQSNLDAINAKYKKFDPTDKQAKLQKHQEITAYNRKYNLKPFVALENFFISTPIFLIIFKVITITRPIKFTVLFGLWDLSKTPSGMIFNHLTGDGWKYLILCLIIIPVNFFSQKINSILTKIRNPHLKKKQEDKNSQAYKMTRIQKIMTVIFLLFVFFWSTSLAIYYFFNSLFTICQHLLIHHILMKRKQKINVSKIKLQKLGLDV